MGFDYVPAELARQPLYARVLHFGGLRRGGAGLDAGRLLASQLRSLALIRLKKHLRRRENAGSSPAVDVRTTVMSGGQGEREKEHGSSKPVELKLRTYPLRDDSSALPCVRLTLVHESGDATDFRTRTRVRHLSEQNGRSEST
jgi:hypothetical protein